MRLVLSWLREFCPVDLSPEALGDLLSAKGLHAESVEWPWEGLNGVVVARVLEVSDHPESAKLCLARIDAGGAERTVVAGVRNMKAGDLVPYAGPGARVPTLSEPLSVRTLRGQLSEGMLCSPQELRISGDHSGILVLPGDAEVGADFKSLFGLDDAVLDLEIEANRPDELSVVGIAREVAAATGIPLTLPDTSVQEAGDSAEEHATVEILDLERCPRYLGRVIVGVAVAPSPIGVQARLTAAGMRPVSTVVDATNYLMLEMGQPMHPFDLAFLNGRGVVVRRAAEGERLITLDDIERVLTSEDLVIADHTRAVGIAGVMGSASAEVSSSTNEVLLESANFSPRFVMQTSRRLLLQTEASIRFSRGADPEAPAPAAARAARLMVEWGGGTVLRGAIDVGRAPVRRRLTVRPGRATALLGYEVSAAEVSEALGRLGIPGQKTDSALEVEVPSYRQDLEQEVDLIEEVVRVQGYDRMPSSVPGIRQAGGMAETLALRRRIREALVRAGLREALSLSFASPADLELMGHTNAVRVANPPAADDPFLRTSLVPNLLKALVRNASRARRGAALFEVGHVFRLGITDGPDVAPVDERESVAAALAGPAEERLHASGRDYDFFDAKGAVEALFGALGVRDWSLGASAGPPFHPARSAVVLIDGAPAGTIGEIHPRTAEALGLSSRVAAFQVDATALASIPRGVHAYRDVPRFPPVRRDLAFVVPAAVPAGDVQLAVADAGGALVDSVALFDAFEGDPIPAGKRNLAFAVDFRAPDRTLTDAEADAAVAAIVGRLERAFGAEFRVG